MPGLFDVPTSSGGSLFSPDLERAAALQGLFAMGNAVGAASQPTPTPGVNPFATAGAAATSAYQDFLKNTVGLGLLNLQMQGLQEDVKAKQRKEALLASIFPQLGGSAATTPGAAVAAPGSVAAGSPTGAPPYPGGTDSIFNDTPQNRLLFSLGLGQDPSKIYSAPTTKMMPLPGTGLLAEHEYRGGRWVPVTGQPQAPEGRAFTADGSLAPIMGGPKDLGVIKAEAGAKESGEAPYKGYPVTQGGRLYFPFGAGGSGSGAVYPSPVAGNGRGSPTAPGPYRQNLPGGGVVFGDPGELGKEAKDAVEKGMLTDSDMLQSMADIKALMKPEYQTIPTKFGMEWNMIKEKWSKNALSPDQKTSVNDFVQYRAAVNQNFSNNLKALSGVAVNPTEFKRAEGLYANAGSPGIFNVLEGDSPTELAAKVDRQNEFIRNAIAKKAYIRERGMDVNGVDIDQMPKIMNDYGQKAYDQFKGEGMSDQAARNAAVRAVAMRFGLLSPRQ